MDSLTLSQYRDVDPETLTTLLDTDWIVRRRRDDMKPKGVYDAGCAGRRRRDPESSHVGLRLVPGNASGEERYTGNRAAWNPRMDELAEMVNDRDAEVFVPLQWVLSAIEADSLEELRADRRDR